MTNRRSAGEGSIFQDPSGRWVGLIELPRQANGKRRRIKRRGRTKADVVRELRKVREQHEQLGDVALANRMVADTLSDYVSQVRETKTRSSTEVARDELLLRVLTAELGRRRTSELTVQDCDNFLEAFISGQLTGSNRALSRDYTNRARSFLSNALKNDMRRSYIVRNVAEVAIVPKTTAASKTKRALSAEEWRRLLNSARNPFKVGVDLGGRHGLRPQEARAMLWSEIRWEAGTISVVNQRDADDELVDPKTVGSTRTIRLHPETIDLLRAWRTAQRQKADRYRWIWSESRPVLSTRYGSPIAQDNYRTSIEVVCRRARVATITPYELRHTAITHQIEAGKTASQIADWAGTSEVMIYKHYRHKLREVVDVEPLDYQSRE